MQKNDENRWKKRLKRALKAWKIAEKGRKLELSFFRLAGGDAHAVRAIFGPRGEDLAL